MHSKILLAFAAIVTGALALPAQQHMIRDQPTPVDNMLNPTLTTVFTTQTFTASQVLESFMTEEPWITTIERMTTWTVTDTVTMEAPAPTP